MLYRYGEWVGVKYRNIFTHIEQSHEKVSEAFDINVFSLTNFFIDHKIKNCKKEII